MAQTCALIAQVQPILHWVPCSTKTLPNAPKCYATQQNKRLGSTWMDRVCSLWKIPRWLHGTNMCINCTGSTYFAPSLCSNKRLSNAPKHYEMLQNMTFGSNGVDRVDSLQKIRCDIMARTFALIAPVQPVLHRVSCSNETIKNTPKYNKTHQYMRFQWGGSGVSIGKNSDATSRHKLVH